MLENPQVLQYFSRDHHHQGFIEKKKHLIACYYKNRLGEFLTRDRHQGCILTSLLFVTGIVFIMTKDRERDILGTVCPKTLRFGFLPR